MNEDEGSAASHFIGEIKSVRPCCCLRQGFLLHTKRTAYFFVKMFKFSLPVLYKCDRISIVERQLSA